MSPLLLCLVIFLMLTCTFTWAGQNFVNVKDCPKNANEWDMRSREKKCYGDTPDYLCAAIENKFDEFGEICTKYGLTPSNKCAVLNAQTKNLDSVDCKAASGCPAQPYIPSELWKYTICYGNFYGTTTTLAQNTIPTNTIEGSRNGTFVGDGSTNGDSVFGVGVAVVIILIIVAVVVIVVFYRRNQYGFRNKVRQLCTDLLKDNLQFASRRNNPLTPLHQVLVSLRFYATGSFYITIADTLNMSKSTAGRAVRLVTELLCRMTNRFICLPSREELVNIKAAFHKIAGFPGVVGCVDGTMVKIKAPYVNEADYICRKGYHALNIQMTCDPRFRIIDLVAKWPGSVHDSRIFRESQLCKIMEEGQIQGTLLGDSGYGLKPYLMTPYLSTETAPSQRFNSAHCRTRVTIEQTYGVLKKRFNALHTGLRANPERACRIITACVILHNIGLDRGDILRDVPQIPVSLGAPDLVLPEDAVGRTVRDHIRDTYFS